MKDMQSFFQMMKISAIFWALSVLYLRFSNLKLLVGLFLKMNSRKNKYQNQLSSTIFLIWSHRQPLENILGLE